jgi:hypothetical protein
MQRQRPSFHLAPTLQGLCKYSRLCEKHRSYVGWAELAKPNKQRVGGAFLLGFVPQPNLRRICAQSLQRRSREPTLQRHDSMDQRSHRATTRAAGAAKIAFPRWSVGTSGAWGS